MHHWMQFWMAFQHFIWYYVKLLPFDSLYFSCFFFFFFFLDMLLYSSWKEERKKPIHKHMNEKHLINKIFLPISVYISCPYWLIHYSKACFRRSFTWIDVVYFRVYVCVFSSLLSFLFNWGEMLYNFLMLFWISILVQ